MFFTVFTAFVSISNFGLWCTTYSVTVGTWHLKIGLSLLSTIKFLDDVSGTPPTEHEGTRMVRSANKIQYQQLTIQSRHCRGAVCV